MTTTEESKSDEKRYTNYKDLCLRVAVWEQYNRRDVYFGDYIPFRDLEIDHIIPQSLYQDQNSDEKNNVLKKYNLPSDFEKDDLLNFVPTARRPNRIKSNFDLPAVTEYALKLAAKNKAEIKKRIDGYYDSFDFCSLATKLKAGLKAKSNGDTELYNIIDILLDDVYPFEKRSYDSTNMYSMSTERVSFTAFLPKEDDYKTSCCFEFRTLHIRNATVTLNANYIYRKILPTYKSTVESRNYIFQTDSDAYLDFPNIRLLMSKQDLEDVCSIIDKYCEKVFESLTILTNQYGLDEFKIHNGRLILLKLKKSDCKKLVEFISEHPIYNNYDLSGSDKWKISISEAGKLHGILNFSNATNNEWLCEDDYYIYENFSYLCSNYSHESFWSPCELRDFLITIIKDSVVQNNNKTRKSKIGFLALPRKTSKGSVIKEAEYSNMVISVAPVIKLNTVNDNTQFQECLKWMERHFYHSMVDNYYLNENLIELLVYLNGIVEVNEDECKNISYYLNFSFWTHKGEFDYELLEKSKKWKPGMYYKKIISGILSSIIHFTKNKESIGNLQINRVMKDLSEVIEIYNHETLIEKFFS